MKLRIAPFIIKASQALRMREVFENNGLRVSLGTVMDFFGKGACYAGETACGGTLEIADITEAECEILRLALAEIGIPASLNP